MKKAIILFAPTVGYTSNMIIFFITLFLLAFALSQSGKEKKIFIRDRKGRFANEEDKVIFYGDMIRAIKAKYE